MRQGLEGRIPPSTVPAGKSGQWSVTHDVVTKKQADSDRLRSIFSGHGRHAQAGPVVVLRHNGNVVMSDTRDERRDHSWIVRQAKGDCLITGLGLGVVLHALLLKPEVTSVTVVESTRFHTVWHDIWPTIHEDHWPEMKALTRSYAQRLHTGGVQSCWCKEMMRPKRDAYSGLMGGCIRVEA